MATWLVTAAAYIPDMVKLAMHFTRGKPKDNATEVFAKQISELQDAATQSTDWAKELVTELQRDITELRKHLADAHARSELQAAELRTARTHCIVAITVAGLAFLVAFYSVAR